MEYLLTSAEMSDADRRTSEEIGIPSIVLMERAALGIAEEIRGESPDGGRSDRIAVIAGKGNNGADALAAGRILLEWGYHVSFFTVEVDPPSAGGSLTEVQLGILRHYGAVTEKIDRERLLLFHPDIMIDGLFGTGLSREVKDPYRGVIQMVNELRELCGSRVYAVDIPSGIDGTTGAVQGCAVRADVTVTFAFYKRGHFLYPGCQYCGRLVRKKIGITARSLSSEPQLFTYRSERAEDLLPARAPDGNKGTFGKVLVIAGSSGISGACTMCAQAVLRMGAGMVRIFTHEDNRIILQETVPEAMCTTWTEKESLRDTTGKLSACLPWADVVAIGPGMGKGEVSLSVLRTVLEYAAGQGKAEEKRASSGRPLRGVVIDADAIRLIAENHLHEMLGAAGHAVPVILTPHMAECAALLNMTISDLKEKRFSAIKDFANLYSCIIIGKDARTLIAAPGRNSLYLNTSGNDGLSTAGSGDVLTGITAGCLAQGMEGFRAACAAVYLHGLAAEQVSEEIGQRSLMATDLIRVLHG